MEMALNTLVQILSEAYDNGYEGFEDRDEAISDIFSKFSVVDTGEEEKPKPPPEEFRVYSVVELSALPVETVMMHELLGKFKVLEQHGEKYALFDNPGLDPALFDVDSYPWNCPVKIIDAE